LPQDEPRYRFAPGTVETADECATYRIRSAGESERAGDSRPRRASCARRKRGSESFGDDNSTDHSFPLSEKIDKIEAIIRIAGL
ncbi:MAG TPA: hypothetical protein VIU85_08220, partial [Chthoniobacterales bacterium]